LISGAKLKQQKNIFIMELSHQIMDSFYDIGVTKIRTARDKGRGTGDKGAANTNEE